MRLADVKIGEKFIRNNKIYLRISMNLSEIFANRTYDELICALDLTNYKVVCLSKLLEVEPYLDNVPV